MDYAIMCFSFTSFVCNISKYVDVYYTFSLFPSTNDIYRVSNDKHVL